jgi:hypothetical protein
MEKNKNIHWLAPVSMLGALAAGTLTAGGHHLFYSHLDGREASSGNIFGSPISRQEANIAIGTAFAFLVKSSLVFALSIAFAQLFWREAKYAVTTPTLARLDSMYSTMYNIFGLCSVPMWFRYPLLALVGASAWYVSCTIVTYF